jgi:hypothetical protein
MYADPLTTNGTPEKYGIVSSVNGVPSFKVTVEPKMLLIAADQNKRITVLK